uniref:Regulatory protein zeste n=1 Tax=Ditylenchus dipsaci TaxID=166011 RepID=A0A915D5U0_9BILA
MKDNICSSSRTPIKKRSRGSNSQKKSGLRLSKYFNYFWTAESVQCPTPPASQTPHLPVFEHDSKEVGAMEDDYNSTLKMVESFTASTQLVSNAGDRARTVKFSDKEDEVMIREYHIRRHSLDSTYSTAIKVSNREKQQKWLEITEIVNQVDCRAVRSVEMVKTRYKNMVSDYKRYKAEIQRTGETSKSREQPFHKILEEVGAEDCSSGAYSGRRSNSLLSVTKEELIDSLEEVRDCGTKSHIDDLLHQSAMLDAAKKRKAEFPLIYNPNNIKVNGGTANNSSSKEERIKDLQIEVLEKQKCLLDFKIVHVQQKLGLLTQEQVDQMFKDN